MKPVPPTTVVWHPGEGERVVIASDDPELVAHAKRLTEEHGPGTWTMSLETHILALQQQQIGGNTIISEVPIWFPWAQLSAIGEG